MSTLAFVIVSIILAIILDWWFVRWLARRRSAGRSAENSLLPSSMPMMGAPPDSPEGSSTGQPAPETALSAAQPRPAAHPSRLRPVNILRQHAALSGALALIIAFGAQSVLTSNQTLLAATGYLIAAVMFVAALRPYIPENFVYEAPSEASPALPSRPLRLGMPAMPRLTAPNFWRHWRHYTVADLLTGARPDIPPEAAPAGPAPAESAATPIGAVEPAPHSPAAAPPASPSAQMSLWSGGAEPFVEPQAVVVTSQGHVIVVDTGSRTIYRFTAGGELLGRWALPELPALHANSLAVSPDGGTLYVADRANRRVQVISLT